MKFFWDKATGLNADIKRHREKEKELTAKINELEGKRDEMSVAALRVFRSFLWQIQQDYASVVTKIGIQNDQR